MEYVLAPVFNSRPLSFRSLSSSAGCAFSYLLDYPCALTSQHSSGHELTLFFDNFETVSFFVSVLLVNLLIQDGKSNYMEGVMLMTLYLVIALACACPHFAFRTLTDFLYLSLGIVNYRVGLRRCWSTGYLHTPQVDVISTSHIDRL